MQSEGRGTRNMPNGRASHSVSPPWPWPWSCLEVLSILQHFQTNWPHQYQQPKQDPEYTTQCRIFISLSNIFAAGTPSAKRPGPVHDLSVLLWKRTMFCAVPLKSAFFLTSTDFCVCLDDVGPLWRSLPLTRHRVGHLQSRRDWLVCVVAALRKLDWR